MPSPDNSFEELQADLETDRSGINLAMNNNDIRVM